MHMFLPHAEDTADSHDFGADLGGSDFGLFSSIDDPLDMGLQNAQNAFLRRIRNQEPDLLPSASDFDLKNDPLLFAKGDSWLGTPTLGEPFGALESNSSASSLTSAGTAAPSSSQRDLRVDEEPHPHASPNTPTLINSSPDLVAGDGTALDGRRISPTRATSPETLSSPLSRDNLAMPPGSMPMGMMPVHERAFAMHRMSMPTLSMNMSQWPPSSHPAHTKSIDLGNPELDISRMRLNSLSSPQGQDTPLGAAFSESTSFMPQSLIEPLRSPHLLRSPHMLRNSASTVGFGHSHSNSSRHGHGHGTETPPIFGMQSQPYPLFVDPLSTNALTMGAMQNSPKTPQTPRGAASPMRRGRPMAGRAPRKAQSTPHFELQQQQQQQQQQHNEISPNKARGNKGLRKIASNRRMAATYISQSMGTEPTRRQGRLQMSGSMAALRQASSLQASLRQPPMQRRPMTLSFVNYGIEDAEELCAAVAPSGSYKVPLRGHDERDSSDQDDAAQQSDAKSQ
ncbi:hypothetical protein MCUN1_003693 [Malassezia cuniculi]|uniref:Uncharacterized protein n=1 Tax=Malassezia cuniculi TaxID=948313 RepID=A0AAF0F228_9BASI|nr:hypothetical protein MCUN1_003693 [Malassezia cuniculi]